jgi:uncharacterized protein with FMN-binding domain
LRTDPIRRYPNSTTKPAPLALPPRRAVATIVATVLGLVLLFSFKTPDSPTDSSLPLAVANGTPVPGATLPSAPRASSRPGTTGRASSPPAPSAQPPSGGNQQVDGDVVSTQFGDIQVRLIESGGKITDVQALQLPNDRRRSREISQFSEPILHDEALQAQSAQIDAVSGATYTSGGYRASLQSALDRVHG